MNDEREIVIPLPPNFRWGVNPGSGDPFEPESHPDCECPRCLIFCAVTGCMSEDVTAHEIYIDRVPIEMARVMLCDSHAPSWEHLSDEAEAEMMTDD